MARLPDSVLESAELDGASETRQFFSIVIPMVWPTITTMSITLISGALGWYIPSLLLVGESMAGATGTGTVAWMIISNVNAGNATGYPAALGVVIAVFGGTFVLLFKKVMERIYPEVEY